MAKKIWMMMMLCLGLALGSRAQEADTTDPVDKDSGVEVPPVSFPLAVRTNLLLPLLNVGVEMPLGNRWSVGADWYYPWQFRAGHHRNCNQALGLAVETRCWLGNSHSRGRTNIPNRLLGHSVGVFAMTGIYDFERNYKGYQGDYVLGGVDYLYARPIMRGRMRMELSLGIGFFHTKATHYEVFVEGGDGYRDKDFRKIFEYFGPLKANVSLVIPLRKQKRLLGAPQD